MDFVKGLIKNVMVFSIINLLPKSIELKLRRRYPYLEHLINIKKWERDNGDLELRINYDLNDQSMVFDLGGFVGKWTENIYKKYACNIFTFEPASDYFKTIEFKFGDYKKIRIFEFGLGARNESLKLYVKGEGSSVYGNSQRSEELRIVKATDFFNENQIHNIDLLKINIEGGEYELINHLVETGFISKIKNLQIQFHYFVPSAWNEMKRIHDKLSETHYLTYQYLFVWENWKLK